MSTLRLYKSIYHVLAFAPLVATAFDRLVLFVFPLDDALGGLSALLRLLSGAAVIFVYYQQVRYLRAVYPNNSLRRQAVLLVAALVIPTIAVTLGDLHGLATFGNESNSTPAYAGFFMGLWVGAAAFGTILWLHAVGNTITILTRGTHNAVRILSKIAHVLMWLALFGLAYFGYAIAYSLRDPSTE